MNKKTLLVFFLMAVLIISGFGSCLSNKGLDDSHNSKNSLDWEGVYSGTIPSASGIGIDVRLRLYPDQTFVLNYEYVDKPDSMSSWTGLFQWDKKGNTITLNIKDVPPYYNVAENMLIQLDMKGKPVSGSLADNYVLKKVL
jgi:uncharacterized lipoprotein NlpE involved in copper resistance